MRQRPIPIFPPLYRYTAGFDSFGSMLGELNQSSHQSGHLPYNIERIGEHEHDISVAVTGFKGDDIHISLVRNELLISGSIERKGEESDKQYLYLGIASQSFQRRFRLNDHIRVADACLEHGILHVDLVQEIPEEKNHARYRCVNTLRTSSQRSLERKPIKLKHFGMRRKCSI